MPPELRKSSSSTYDRRSKPMTLKAFSAQAKRIRFLEGEVCIRASTTVHPWALRLDFGPPSSPENDGHDTSPKSLIVEYPWRLETKDAVLVGSGDDVGYPEEDRPLAAERIRSKLQLCAGRRVTHVEVHQPSYMVRLSFDDTLYLWVFPDASEDFAEQSADPQISWYVIGSQFSKNWEE